MIELPHRQLETKDRPARWTLPAIPERLPPHALDGLDREDAFRVLRARRFYSAVGQRISECRRTKRQLQETIDARRHAERQPWITATHDAHLEIARRHPQEYAYIRARILEVLQQGRPERNIERGDQKRDTLKHEVLAALRDNSWRPPATLAAADPPTHRAA